MTDNVIPPWEFKAACPQCGSDLGIERKTEQFPVQLEGHERLICPTHGDVMSLEEARRLAFEKSGDDIIDKAKKFAVDSIRDALKRG
jgi:hypothetical protein